MKKLLVMLIIGFGYFYTAKAQFPTCYLVSGKVQDANGQPIENTKITLYRMADTFYKKPSIEQILNVPNDVFSEVLASVSSVKSGSFEINAPMPLFKSQSNSGESRRGFRSPHTFSAYVVVVAEGFEPYKSYVNWKPTRSAEGPSLTLEEPFVLLKLKDRMQGVEIKTNAIVQKGDTSELSAANYKVNPDATAEDLVRKMPGVTSSNGQVQAQGEQVKKVLVDGKPFFGDDPNTALKNLPAEVVSKIQIYDGRSDQSAFTGFDDGNTTKTMNIITKMGFKNGLFGKAFGGYGRSFDGSGDINKYKGGLNLNYFSGDRRITLLSQINNINEQNFSIEDIMGSMGGGSRGGRGSGGGMFGGAGGSMGGSGQFFVGSQNGITSTAAIGLSYSDKLGKKKTVDFSASYFLNNTDNDNSTSTNRIFVTGSQTGYNYNETAQNLAHNRNHRFNMRFDWRPDTVNRIIIQPRLTLQTNGNKNPLTGITSNAESVDSVFSKLVNGYINNSVGYNGGVNINWMRSFQKKGRTISVSVNPGITNQTGETNINNRSVFNIFGNKIDTVKLQRLDIGKTGLTLNGNLTFTEGLDSNNLISAMYTGNLNQNGSNRLNYVPQNYLSEINYLDTILSNKYKNGYSSHSVGGQYQFQNFKWNTNIGVSGQVALLNGDQTFPVITNISRQFYSILPSFSVRYKLGMKKNLRLNYRTSNNAPSVDQLQEVINNSISLQLSVGNKSLVQDYQHNLTMRYFSVIPEKGKNLFVLINATFTKNYISSLTQIAGNSPLMVKVGDTGVIRLNPGAQLSKAINMDGYYNLRLFGTYGTPLDSGKLNLNVNMGLNYVQTPSLIQIGNSEAKANTSKNPSANFGLVLGTNLNKLDITLMSTTTYSYVMNTLQKSLNQSYINQSTQFKLNYNPTENWALVSDVTQSAYTGLSNSYNQTFYLWNMGLAKKFLKNTIEIRLSIYDILNQNKAIARNVTQTYFEDVRTKVLTRYAMLTVTYNLRQFKGSKDQGKDEKDRRMYMFPGGTPPPGMPMPGMGMPHGGGLN